MQSGRKSAKWKPQPPPESNSDDEAPEEFTQAQARDKAMQQRKNEQLQRDAQRRAQREQRRARHKAADPASVPSEGGGKETDGDEQDNGRLESHPEASSGGIEDDFDEEELAEGGTADLVGLRRQPASKCNGKEDDTEDVRAGAVTRKEVSEKGKRKKAFADSTEDLLPESVLVEVAARDKAAQMAAAFAAAEAVLNTRAQRKAAKRQRLQAVTQSVVAVEVLPKLKAPTFSSNFMKESLYGNRIRRSIDMITKAKNRPATKFV